MENKNNHRLIYEIIENINKNTIAEIDTEKCTANIGLNCSYSNNLNYGGYYGNKNRLKM